jgi:hypothetical protein
VKALTLLLRCVLCLLVVLGLLWSGAALWIDGPPSRFSAGALVAGMLITSCSAVLLLRTFRRRLAGAALPIFIVALWWLNLTPLNDRNWQPDVARLPTATLEGSLLTINNVRSFRYNSIDDAEERWITATYDLDELIGFDIFFSFWGPEAYGHTIASWEFADGRHLAVSIETRKEVGEEYSALRGFFRQFELYYVVAEETDVIKLRTNHRLEQVELYRIFTPNEGDRAMLMNYIEDINDLAANPRWYNALTQNCTTTIWDHAKAVGSRFPLDWRLLANGYVLELAYQLGTVNSEMPLNELRSRSNITARAQAVSSDDDFSAAIRESLPERPTQFPDRLRTEG